MQHADWLICLVWIQDGSITTNITFLRDKLSEFDEKFNELKVDSGSTLSNNFLQPATNVFLARQVDHAR